MLVLSGNGFLPESRQLENNLQALEIATHIQPNIHEGNTSLYIMKQKSDTVKVTLYDCEECELSMTPTYHGDGCDSPALYIGSELLCSGCGATIAPPETESCSDCGAPAPPFQYPVPLDFSPSISPTKVEQAVHTVTNQYRTEHNLPMLSYSGHLSGIALQHSRDMAVREYFDHQSPDGDGTEDRYRAHKHSDNSYGENIAYRQPGPTISVIDLAESIVDGWMDSKGHRENILQERFREEGIGVYTTNDGTVYVTQNFS